MSWWAVIRMTVYTTSYAAMWTSEGYAIWLRTSLILQRPSHTEVYLDQRLRKGGKAEQELLPAVAYDGLQYYMYLPDKSFGTIRSATRRNKSGCYLRYGRESVSPSVLTQHLYRSRNAVSISSCSHFFCRSVVVCVMNQILNLSALPICDSRFIKGRSFCVQGPVI
jgi:hypothetical protein